MEKNNNNTNEVTIEQVKKFDYDFTKGIKAALERGKNKKNLIK